MWFWSFGYGKRHWHSHWRLKLEMKWKLAWSFGRSSSRVAIILSQSNCFNHQFQSLTNLSQRSTVSKVIDSDDGMSILAGVYLDVKVTLSVARLFWNEYSIDDTSSILFDSVGTNNVISMVTAFKNRNSYDDISSLESKSFIAHSCLSVVPRPHYGNSKDDISSLEWKRFNSSNTLSVVTGSRNRNFDDDIGSLKWKSFKASSTLLVVTRLHHGNSSNGRCLIIHWGVLLVTELLSGAIHQAWVQRRWYQLTEKRWLGSKWDPLRSTMLQICIQRR